MENDIKKEARRQYLHFFRIWFIVLGVLFVVAILADKKRRKQCKKL